MPEDYYPPADSEEGNLPPADEGEKTDQETALVPKAMLGEVKPGDTCTFKVVHIYEDEVELALAGEGETEKPETETERPGYESELDALATEGE